MKLRLTKKLCQIFWAMSSFNVVSRVNKLVLRLIYKFHVITIITDSLHSNSFQKAFWQHSVYNQIKIANVI